VEYHAIVLHSHFTAPRVIQHHTRHRSLAAAARSLSKGITAALSPAPAYVTWCGVVAPCGAVMSLRQAQGKMARNAVLYPGLIDALRVVASEG